MPVILLLSGIFILLSDQPVLMAVSILSYVSIIKLFWKDDEPKIIFFGLTMFWLSITIKLFYAIYAGVNYESLSKSSNIVSTTYSALLSFVMYGLGIYFATKKVRRKATINLKKDLGYSSKRIFIVFGGAIVAGSLLRGAVYFIPGLNQIVYSLLDLKMGFIFLLVYAAFNRKDNLPFVLALLGVEIILSFFSLFSSFKDILFTVLIGVATYRINFTFKNVVTYGLIGFITMYMLFTWQTIKDQYRSFLNKDSKEQVVKVSQEEAFDKLSELASKKTDESKREDILYASIDRLSYIEFFSEARQKVPDFIPFENGKLWSANLQHIFLPRILFPDKAIIDDSQMVNKYCTRKVLTAKVGVTFSLGFIAESYIDFGPVLMYVIIFLVGIFSGFIYSVILRSSINLFWAYTMLLPFYVKISINGTPGTKVLGMTITYLVAFFIFKKLLMERLDNFMKGGRMIVKTKKETWKEKEREQSSSTV